MTESNRNGWTPERRKRQAESIKNWRPWDKATGPKTPEGKAASKMNGYKGGTWKQIREAQKALNAALREQADFISRL